MSSHSKFLNTKYFSSLNGLRCLAVIFVIGFHHNGHYSIQGIHNPGLHQVFFRGYLGVDLFFVLSGFLITTLLLAEKELHKTISVRLFYIRRILRIFPLYYAMLTIYAILLVPLLALNQYAKSEFYHNLPYFLTYTSNWFVESGSGIFVFAWTLATEEQFYFIWPHVLKVFKKGMVVLIIAFIIFLNQAALFGLIAPWGFMSSSQNHLVLRIINQISTPICLGCLLSLGLRSRKIYEGLIIFKSPYASAGWLMVLIFCIYWPQEITPAWRLVLAFCLTLFVGSCVYQEKHCLSKILGSRIFSQVGTVSYGMYLFSFASIYAVYELFHFMRWGNPYLECLVSLVLIFMLANMSFYYYERRFLNLKERYQHLSQR